jgi:MFS transporter, UMF1 family
VHGFSPAFGRGFRRIRAQRNGGRGHTAGVPSPDPGQPAAAATHPTPRRTRAAAWVLYDVANTVYAATLTFLFTPYAERELDGLGGLGIAQAIAMVLAAVLVPALGALCDQTARTRSYLTIATLACIAAIAGLGLAQSHAVLLGCLLVASLTYNLGLVAYNTLLPAVAAPGQEGRLSGLGTGFGYLGTIVVLVALLPLADPRSRFLSAAGLFLLLALPCLLLVHDPRPSRPGTLRTAIAATFADLRQSLQELRQLPSLRWFLLGNFFLLDVVNTAILYFASFTTGTFGAAAASGELTLLGLRFDGVTGPDRLVQLCGLSLNVLALVFGVLQGKPSDRRPLAVMRASGIALLLALIGGALFGGNSVLGYLLTLVALGAFGLAGVQTAGRKVVLLLAPSDRVGAYFGLYGITLKLSVLGSLAYGLIADAAGPRAAMLAQAVPLLLGLACLAMVRMPAHE